MGHYASELESPEEASARVAEEQKKLDALDDTERLVSWLVEEMTHHGAYLSDGAELKRYLIKKLTGRYV